MSEKRSSVFLEGTFRKGGKVGGRKKKSAPEGKTLEGKKKSREKKQPPREEGGRGTKRSRRGTGGRDGSIKKYRGKGGKLATDLLSGKEPAGVGGREKRSDQLGASVGKKKISMESKKKRGSGQKDEGGET